MKTIRTLNIGRLGFKDMVGMVERLVREGMDVKKAVHITAQTFKFDEEALLEHFEVESEV